MKNDFKGLWNQIKKIPLDESLKLNIIEKSNIFRELNEEGLYKELLTFNTML